MARPRATARRCTGLGLFRLASFVQSQFINRRSKSYIAINGQGTQPMNYDLQNANHEL
jgi:hypothetical protein